MKKLLIFIAFLFLSLGSVFWYYYFIMWVNPITLILNQWISNLDNLNSNNDSNSNNDIKLIQDINFSWKVDFNLDIPMNNTNISTSIWNFSLLSQDNALQQRIKINDFNFLMSIDWIIEELYFWLFDLISNEEKVFYTLLDNNLDTINDIFQWIVSGDEYFMIDNSQNIINLLWELASNELLINFIKWLSTSNPSYYFEKYWINDEFKNIIFNDWFYNLLFNEKGSVWDKIILEFDENICEFLVNIYDWLSEFNNWFKLFPLNLDLCNIFLSNINEFLWNDLYLLTDWFKENIVYEWLITFSIIYWWWDFISYKLNTPFWLKSEYLDNTLKVNFDSPILKMIWYDLKFDFEMYFNNKNEFNLTISYSDQTWWMFLLDIMWNSQWEYEFTTRWQFQSWWELIRWQWDGDNVSWNFRLMVRENNSVLLNLLLNYSETDFNLSIISNDFKILSNLDFSWDELLYDLEISWDYIEILFNFSWDIWYNSTNADFVWNYSLYWNEWKINWNITHNNDYLNIYWENIFEWETYYFDMQWLYSNNAIDLSWDIWIIQWENVSIINIMFYYLNIYNNQSWSIEYLFSVYSPFFTIMESSLSILYDIWEFEYFIPSNYNSISSDFNFILPDLRLYY